MIETVYCPDEAATLRLAASLAPRWASGDWVRLEGPLGAGKTTLVRGLLGELGWAGAVRSPTFSLVQTYPTVPPVLHADLYRLTSAQGTGIEDYLDTHLCLIEWPDRLEGWLDLSTAWRVQIAFRDPGRTVTISPPGTLGP